MDRCGEDTADQAGRVTIYHYLRDNPTTAGSSILLCEEERSDDEQRRSVCKPGRFETVPRSHPAKGKVLSIAQRCSLMAKRRAKSRKRRRNNFIAIPFEVESDLAGMTAGELREIGMLGAVLGEDLYCISVDATYTLRDKDTGEGPIQIGYHHSDLSVTEVAEALAAQVTDPDDIIAKERARRPVRRAGVFPIAGTDVEIRHGAKFRTKLGWSTGDGHNPALWVKNEDSTTLAAGTLIVGGTLFGRWQR